MSQPRGVSERLDWMLDHPPGEPGMCARESWQALGGDQDPPSPPAWGTPNANAVYDNIIASGRYWTDTPIPRGAFIAWRYGNNGHAALSYGEGKIVTTDPTNDPGGTGIEPLSYPERWGATSAKRIYTDQYNGVRFDVEGGEDVSNNYDYDYLDKPAGTFTITRSYKDLDQSEWSPPRSGWESTQVYLNVKPKFKSGKTHGAIRVRVMRENDDSTGHDTLPIDADDLDSDGRVLLRYYYWEKGGAGDSTVVQLMCVGGLESAEVGTRYTKRVTVVD